MARKAPTKLARLMKTGLLVLFIIAASVGATLYYSLQQSSTPAWLAWAEKGQSVEAAPAPDEPPVVKVNAKPIFAPLDPFTVTLNENGRSRILYVGITLRVQDDGSRAMLVEYMPMVRDRVLKILAEQRPTYIQTSEGRQALVAQLSAGLKEPYAPNTAVPYINDVLFTAFVIQ
ncbi:flagellar basal body-associated protein FliL [Alcaligenes faecalis]|jgi:flagellar FliL protein|uniref:Flagellar protein FliL n=2 Tax=Alcaligenes faecalis TaxID=511 RepID=A0A0M7G376_ALCFA|nr:flagellar basal body-associated FliL family protein [Alcaligenes faecalis]MBW4789588.1 flagellar basal body-associated FliL family protein [Alcaligenes faecalis subsp. faecalis]GAU74512.1 flagellar protein FliL [Alcaligenes faecalis subsp. faecalis NBRC 13111]ALO39564.1 flagellar protein FliL [Alcaligenes faecalis]ARP53110.1 flagellar protein [Alcaligenes faecalis]ATH99109.1 flagellar protein FliL [Alcaligenes faecalis]